jgi:hypothetical protein
VYAIPTGARSKIERNRVGMASLRGMYFEDSPVERTACRIPAQVTMQDHPAPMQCGARSL